MRRFDTRTALTGFAIEIGLGVVGLLLVAVGLELVGVPILRVVSRGAW